MARRCNTHSRAYRPLRAIIKSGENVDRHVSVAQHTRAHQQPRDMALYYIITPEASFSARQVFPRVTAAINLSDFISTTGFTGHASIVDCVGYRPAIISVRVDMGRERIEAARADYAAITLRLSS